MVESFVPHRQFHSSHKVQEEMYSAGMDGFTRILCGFVSWEMGKTQPQPAVILLSLSLLTLSP